MAADDAAHRTPPPRQVERVHLLPWLAPLGPTPPAASEQASWLRSAAAGDRAAWEQLVDLHTPALWGSARQVSRSDEAAEAAVALAWHAAAQRLDELGREPSRLLPLLHGVVASQLGGATWPNAMQRRGG